MNKTGAISVFAILFYTQLGYYGQFVLQQWVLKEKAREAWIATLPDRCFFRVRLADVNTSGHWEEEGKECWYNSHLYDVIRQKDERGVLWLYCTDDEGEAKLIRQSGEMTCTNYNHPDKQTNHFLSLRIAEWLAETISLKVGRPLVLVEHCYGYGLASLSLGYFEIEVPPPKI